MLMLPKSSWHNKFSLSNKTCVSFFYWQHQFGNDHGWLVQRFIHYLLTYRKPKQWFIIEALVTCCSSVIVFAFLSFDSLNSDIKCKWVSSTPWSSPSVTSYLENCKLKYCKSAVKFGWCIFYIHIHIRKTKHCSNILYTSTVAKITTRSL